MQDRLKSIFAKLGVRSRRELVAKLDQRLGYGRERGTALVEL